MESFARMLASEDRPVGLSILAGVVFVVAALDAVGTAAFGIALVSRLEPSFTPDWMSPVILDAMRGAPLWYVAAATFVLFPVKTGLLVAAGLAFLARRRRGRLLANLYVATSLVESVVTGVAMGTNLGTFVAALFPCLIFLGVNKIFAEDLSH